MTTKSKSKKSQGNLNVADAQPPAAKAMSPGVRRSASIEDSPVVMFVERDECGVYLPFDVAASAAALLSDYANIKRPDDYTRATMAERLVRVLNGPLLMEYGGAPADRQPLVSASINETVHKPKMEVLLQQKKPMG